MRALLKDRRVSAAKGRTAGSGRRSRSQRRTFFVRAAAILIALCLIAALALPALAAESAESEEPETASQEDTYTYTVRIFPGVQGTINGSEEPFIRTNIQPGYQWSRDDFDYRTQAASKTDKYYVTGMRESGKDNNTREQVDALIKGGAFTVDRDIDLVISYGMKGTEVAYTVHYKELGTDKDLPAPEGHSNPETFYGNIGEKPVVSYLYISGYIPQYKNLTGTLDSDASKNEWTFYYVAESESGSGGGSQDTSGDSAEISGGGNTADGTGLSTTGSETASSSDSSSGSKSSGSSSSSS
ncbi:MAG: hypothetical protein Q4D81_15175, partial [Eubacteriales bacterium]|nr:hypothetical protein [Eubacteriales bacterium]